MPVSQVKKETKKIKLMFFRWIVFSRQNTRVSNYFGDQSGIGTVYISISKDGLAHLSYDLTNFNPAKCFTYVNVLTYVLNLLPLAFWQEKHSLALFSKPWNKLKKNINKRRESRWYI